METFEDQLDAIDKAIIATDDSNERSSLELLKSDILQLLELTKQTQTTKKENVTAESDDNMDIEMRKFMEEISEIETITTDGKTEKTDASTTESEDFMQVKKFRDELKKMVGQKCSAPHRHTWGAITYHNAVVCAVEDSVEFGDDGTLNGQLRVLFTNPTHREMLPCKYFLEGHCRFDDKECHYSHGELVSPTDLREYSEPDFSNLARNYVVLAKLQTDNLWHRGRVICTNFVEQNCRVRLDGKDKKDCDHDFAFEDLFPIYFDDDFSSESDTDVENDTALEETVVLEQSLFTYKHTQSLGEWEKHTRGIGSKLMSKMGYIHGTGLGSDGRGIITPISAQILPQGCSLDHCMQLREAANGDKDFFSAEKKIKRDQKKQNALNAKIYERESKNVNVFSFLNDKILSNSDKQAQSGSTKRGETKSCFTNQTTKSLNIESVRIADDMRRKEREIATLQQSIQRNKNNNEMCKRLQSQLNYKKLELSTLQKDEKNVSKEQITRRTKDKLCVF